MENIKIVSTVNYRIVVIAPTLNFRRELPTKGSSFTIDKDTFSQLMYDYGFQSMINDGTLYIEDMKVKQELGLEPEGVSEPTNIIVLSDKEKRSYLTTLSLVGFKDKIKKLSNTQLNALVDFAIDNRLVDLDKCNVLKEATNRDIIQSIRLRDQDKEK